MSSSITVTEHELARNSDAALKASQQGPVIITKQGKSFSVLVSYHDIELQLKMLIVQKEIDRRKEKLLFGAKSNELSGNPLTKEEISDLLAMIDEGLSTDEMVARVMAENCVSTYPCPFMGKENRYKRVTNKCSSTAKNIRVNQI